MANSEEKYKSNILKAIITIRGDLHGIRELTFVKMFAYTENNVKKIDELVRSGRLEEIADMNEHDLEENKGTDLIVVKFLDSSLSQFVALLYDSDELWQDPEAIEVIQIK